jgi:septum formation protein
VLASASPRRRELLRAAGYAFDVDPVTADERPLPNETAAAHVERLARVKATLGARRHPEAIVLGADTVVVIDDEILGKPTGPAQAREMLSRLSGRTHDVVTGVAVAAGGRIVARVERTSVWVKLLSEAELVWYVDSGEPLDKAGGYAIQGLAARFVPRIEGSYSNVVGLPISVVADMLAGLPVGAAGSSPHAPGGAARPRRLS